MAVWHGQSSNYIDSAATESVTYCTLVFAQLFSSLSRKLDCHAMRLPRDARTGPGSWKPETADYMCGLLDSSEASSGSYHEGGWKGE